MSVTGVSQSTAWGQIGLSQSSWDIWVLWTLLGISLSASAGGGGGGRATNIVQVNINT